MRCEYTHNRIGSCLTESRGEEEDAGGLRKKYRRRVRLEPFFSHSFAGVVGDRDTLLLLLLPDGGSHSLVLSYDRWLVAVAAAGGDHAASQPPNTNTNTPGR